MTYAQSWYARNRDRKLAYERARREADPLAARERSRQYYAAHQEGLRSKHREWHARNLDRAHERNRVWRDANPERLAELRRANRAANHDARVQAAIARRRSYVPSHSTAEWEAKKAAFAYRCAYCGDRPARLTKDHVVPVRDHPDRLTVDAIDNIVPACLPCNLRKGTKRWT